MEKPVFRERVTPNPASYLLPLLAGLGFFAVFLPVVAEYAFAFGIGALAIVLVLQIVLSPVIVVTKTHLRVGKACIERRHLGAVEMFEGAIKREQLGVALDARAFVKLQASARQVIRVQIHDEEDPVPYWIFSTKHGAEILQVLG